MRHAQDASTERELRSTLRNYSVHVELRTYVKLVSSSYTLQYQCIYFQQTGAKFLQVETSQSMRIVTGQLSPERGQLII